MLSAGLLWLDGRSTLSRQGSVTGALLLAGSGVLPRRALGDRRSPRGGGVRASGLAGTSNLARRAATLELDPVLTRGGGLKRSWLASGASSGSEAGIAAQWGLVGRLHGCSGHQTALTCLQRPAADGRA